MKILITGTAGFIGSHLADRLLECGHDVVGLDNFSTGSATNVQHLMSNQRFQPVTGSVLDESTLGPLIKEADLVYHLAAAVGVKFVLEHLVETIQTNARGTENVIQFAQESGNTKIILASTSEVYGKSENLPYKEDDNVVMGPTVVGRWGYACTKMLDEFLALAYYKEKGLPVVILRLFNVTGPRQTSRFGMVVPQFVAQCLAGEPITVHGDGTQYRCFSYVGDVVQAMIDISQVPQAEGQVFNLGNDQPITVEALALLVKETLKSSSPIVHVPYSDVHSKDFEDVPCRIPDITKIQGVIDFHPRTDWSRIILEIADYLQVASAGSRAGQGV